MNILVSNIGSTSVKFRLFDMGRNSESQVASVAADRIAQRGGRLSLRIGQAEPSTQAINFAHHGSAIRCVMQKLADGGALTDPSGLDAVAFKVVMAGDRPPAAMIDEEVLAAMEYYSPVAPAHNPPYVAAIRLFADALAGVPLVAVFETGFHRTIPPRRRLYAISPTWASKYGIKRYGFHGASHQYVAARMAELMPEARCVISCHLGGSSSLCAMHDGQSVATSMGLSPQSGVPQSNRVGDIDPFALALLRRQAKMHTEDILLALGSQSGLAALSGTSGDMRDIEQASEAQDQDARLALEVYVTAIRDFLGAYLVELGGADALVFTGGIGQNSPTVRASVCQGLKFAGIDLDAGRNRKARPDDRIDSAVSRAAVWVLETNEELIVARQAFVLLAGQSDSNEQKG
jgi:acetate kinase